jgi:hypothetical protein
MASRKAAHVPSDLARYARLQLSPLAYAREILEFDPFPWQADVLACYAKRIHLNAARQSGKSTITAIPAVHRARFYPNSLWIVAAATETQAMEDMEKIKAFIAMDEEFPAYVREGADLLKFTNGARILVVPATEKAGGRAFSNPDGITLDEDSYIPDRVFRSSTRPLLTANRKCVLYLLSTPNGRGGHFFRNSTNTRWTRFEIRSPYEPNDAEWTLHLHIPEEQYRAQRIEKGIKAYYSPRHYDLEEQQEMLDDLGPRIYRQEECCEFVESEDQVFSNADIEAMYSEDVKPLVLGSSAIKTEAVRAFQPKPRGRPTR